jgi:uncharacterized protein
MIVELVKKGKKVGICATAHKAITNLVDEVCAAAAEAKATIRIVQKGDDGDGSTRAESGSRRRTRRSSRAAEGPSRSPREPSGSLAVRARCRAASTSSRGRGRADVLASVVAISSAAKSLVLLGDPNQLPQVSQGTHPDGAGVSALEHVLAGDQTLRPDQGLFLETTWRLHPDVCAFTSEVFYEGRLKPEAQNANQRIGGQPLSGCTRHGTVRSTRETPPAPPRRRGR